MKENLYKKFNPTQFRAQDWIDVAKSAQMRCVVCTTKHLDGFCNFDTQLTDYKMQLYEQ